MQAGIILTRHDINRKFYDREVENTDILYGKVWPLRFVESLVVIAWACSCIFKG